MLVIFSFVKLRKLKTGFQNKISLNSGLVICIALSRLTPFLLLLNLLFLVLIN